MPALFISAFAAVVAVLFLVYVRVRRRPQFAGFLDIQALRQLSWGELEILIADYFIREGFVIRETGGKAVDFVMEKSGRRCLVQCKHWRSRVIGAPEVRDLFGHMAAVNAKGAYLITIGRFTPAAVQFASGKRIELIDGDGFVRMVEEVQQDPSEITQSRLEALRDADRTTPRRVILCPRCGRSMKRRRERSWNSIGDTNGREFYGCSRYPTCKGRREIA